MKSRTKTLYSRKEDEKGDIPVNYVSVGRKK